MKPYTAPTVRVKRIAFLALIAALLVLYSIRTDGWAATLPPIKFFLLGCVSLHILFRRLGWIT